MAKVIIVYESKYGNTKTVAETIAAGMMANPGVEPVLVEVGKADAKQAAGFDAILLGAPNHMGRPTGGITKFIGKLGKLGLEGKPAAVFDTYMGGDYEKAVKKMEKQIADKVRGLRLVAPGLSIRVQGMKGPIAEGELPKCREFGERVAAFIGKSAQA